MFKNYLTIAIRNLLRNKTSSLINILGLSVGLACCIMIFLFIKHELSFDQHYLNKNQVYRINSSESSSNGIDYGSETPFPLVPLLQAQKLENAQFIRTQHSMNADVTIGEKKYHDEKALFASPDFFDLFEQKWISGNAATSLQELNTVILTQSLAEKYFPDTDPIGKTFVIKDIGNLAVSGIIADPPKTTHLPFSMILNTGNLTPEYIGMNYDMLSINLTGFNAYVKLPEDINFKDFENNINALTSDHFFGNNTEDISTRLILQPLLEIHFDDRFSSFNYITTKKTIWILSLVGLLILIIACINYINLSIAQSIRRSKEVGIRKVVGAERKKILFQFIGESIFVTLFAAIIALIIAEIFLPSLNQYLGNDFDLSNYKNPAIIFGVLLTTVIIGILTGIYPALIVSGFRPLDALNNRVSSHKKGMGFFKNSLVIFQFIIAQLLIISTLIVSLQMDYLQKKETGFSKENIITVPLPDIDKRQDFKDRLTGLAGIESVSVCGTGPQSIADDRFESIIFLRSEGRETMKTCEVKTVDEDYQKVFGLEMLAGQWMNRPYGADSIRNVVINEATTRILGFDLPEQAIGKQINYGRIVGVAEDFHSESLHRNIIPVVIFYYPRFFFAAYIKIQPGNIENNLANIETLWSETFPDEMFSYEVYDEYLNKMYSNDKRTFDILRLFSLIAILIACMGLYGLVSYLMVQKTREISIRKVMGASVAQIMGKMASGYLKLILIANIIAIPLAWYFMANWLENFAFRINIQIWVFVLAILISVIVALSTIIFQILKIARINPSVSLKCE
jgi:putative ABC transport system permease protein